MTSSTQRADLIGKLLKVAKKSYQPSYPPANRTALEHLLYSCCLEDSTNEAADEVFARLLVEYYDLNEVRVTTTAELAELMKRLYDAQAAANRIRKALHGVFEAHYAFDLEPLKKETLGKAQEQLAKYRGITPFGIAYVTQHALGGHSIPIDAAMLQLFYTLGVITEAERDEAKVPGLERAVPKNKGIEFFAVVHPLAVAFLQSPFNKDLRSLLLSIAPDANERFPKRGGGRKSESDASPDAGPAEAADEGKKGSKRKADAAADGKSLKREKGAKAAKAEKSKTREVKKGAKKEGKSSGKSGAVSRPAKKKSPTKKLAKKKPR